MRISDWSSDVCSSDLCVLRHPAHVDVLAPRGGFELGDARVLRAGLEHHLAHVAGVVLDGRGHGVDAGDPLVFLAHVVFWLSQERTWARQTFAAKAIAPKCAPTGSIRFLGALRRLPARRQRLGATAVAVLADQPEVDLALLQAGLETHDQKGTRLNSSQ